MRPIPALLALLLFSSLGVDAAQIYRWVDEQGVTHFGEQPPTGQSATTLTPNPAPGVGAAPESLPSADRLPRLDSQMEDDIQKGYDEKARQQAAKQEAELKRYCENVRSSLAQLRANARLRVKDEDGGMHYLTAEERQARIAEAEQGISEHCRTPR